MLMFPSLFKMFRNVLHKTMWIQKEYFVMYVMS